MQSMKFRFLKFVSVALLLIFTSITVLAQDTALYEDPAGRFSVPSPSGWAEESTSEVGRFVSTDGVIASILALNAADAESGEQAVLAVLAPELAGTAPVQSGAQPTPGGTWTVSIFAPAPDRLVALATQWIDGVTYALLFDMPGQEALNANQGYILGMFNGFSVGERLDLTDVQPQAFTAEMLADFENYVELAREHFHVPGVSIAIVQNGEVVYTGGFGNTEAASGQPVTADTLFMIGSVTKSMTTMMIGTLVDEGVLDWDQPVTEVLPSFALSDPAATAQIRLRDLLNMSSGVPRYDITTTLQVFTPQELIASLAGIPMVAAPGEIWNYSNQMVATGGFLSAMVTGSSLDGLYEGYTTLIQDRVFDAIGMLNSTFDFDTATANPNHALPFVYNSTTQEYVSIPLDNERFTKPVAPAGAVWSNAADMARYLQTELSGGISPDGTRVISEATLHTTQSSEIAPGGLYLSYGMGWGVHTYNDQTLILHGGNTLGFTSDMAFLPDSDLGIVILADVADANSFVASVREYAFELAFGLEHEASMYYAASYGTGAEQASPAPIDVETVTPYLGEYEYGAALEMRGDEMWFTGAFIQTPLYPINDAGDYAAINEFSALRIHFAGSGDQPVLEISYPQNPNVTVNKVN